MTGIKLPPKKQSHKPVGVLTDRNGEPCYKITNYNAMDPFFISIVSGFDHWLFLSTTGGITAGRKDSSMALFPYYTEDKIADNCNTTGSLTHLIIRKSEEEYLWSPFDPLSPTLYNVERNLYKSVYGEKIWFEEINFDLGLSFQYGWMTGDSFGIIRESRLGMLPGTGPCNIRICDGVRNVLPSGTPAQLQNEMSCLLDAYKKTELHTATGMGFFRLSSLMTDRAEPSESLRANTIFTLGINPDEILLSSRQINNFLSGDKVTTEKDVKGSRGAYFVVKDWNLAAGDTHTWYMAADVNKDHSAVADMISRLESGKITIEGLLEDIRKGTEQLKHFVSLSDGIQNTGKEINGIHHFANVMFNIMRGGIFASEYEIEISDFCEFLSVRNKQTAMEVSPLLKALPANLQRTALSDEIDKLNNNDLKRLFLEYLPLSFSRRHGDPSRPWNQFSIILKDDKNRPRLNYQGNWRDIFQNWEALAYSFPQYLDGMITRFLCATTADGYNPYRVTRDGFEWEEPEPNNPWANIGYWQDHQIIYLEKLLEVFHDHYPGKIGGFLTSDIFTYADIPYRLKSYGEICQNYRDTIYFDHEENKKIHENVNRIGTDGKLLSDASGKILRVNMTEKLLSLYLTKLINYVPGGGIWMNTQRPEWNDANNALVGPGLSMVTLFYLRRFTLFWMEIMEESGIEETLVSNEITKYFHNVLKILKDIPETAHTDSQSRKLIMDALGEAGSHYRESLYQNGLSGTKSILKFQEIKELCKAFLQTGDTTMKLNRRDDGLYHSYNLLEFMNDNKEARIKFLYEMLEGQVAVLSSGFLEPREAAELLESLKISSLYRKDQNSYILYPNRELPDFNSMNNLELKEIQNIPLLKKLKDDGREDILATDCFGILHFHSDFHNNSYLQITLNKLKKDSTYSKLAIDSEKQILDLYEKHFNHISFTGRSGTFFAYEGLGSIYWHMVSKLLLACQENSRKASGSTKKILESFYKDIRNGIGYHKSPAEYGAFPSDPYSHTPMHSGARQPGMTGQVKEEVITRRYELGVSVKDGSILFDPDLLESEEFLKDTIHFTIYRVPVRYTREAGLGMSILFENGEKQNTKDLILSKEISRSIFNGTAVSGELGKVKEIVVFTGKN